MSYESSSTMEPIHFEDERGGCLSLLEDAGCYFSPNVQPEHIVNLQNFKARSDDILLVTYPKSGTHWLSEIISMLVNGCHRLTKDTMKHLEYLPVEVLDSMPSPRVICSHLPYPRIPLDFHRKRAKIVVCMRNPRDVAVSYFKFISNLNFWNYSGYWDGFVPLFINGNLPYNSWFEHTDTWLKVARSGKHNIHVVFYEDLHRDFNSTVSRLADFLDVDYTPELIDAVHIETTFDNMKSHKDDFTLPLSKNGESPIYRKGEVGDWVNWFTHEQIDQIDQEMEAWGLHLDNRIKYFTDQPNPTST
ncbi:sulfotransferase 1E1-like [Physella acuta]|uniref:sulfotransferase 1E1-like n=1 Tax=Physella acuta TaxID=109671 RepID=UPI0027DD2363|nr:sulfotransferase 1E1-like [Physella acuta]